MKMSDTPSPLWNVPYQRNPFFTGREEMLNHLHTSLRAENAVALADTQGNTSLGGVDKTQIALGYVYRTSEHYHAIF